MAKQSFDHYLIPTFMSHRSLTDDKRSITALYESLPEDKTRNLIVEDVINVMNPDFHAEYIFRKYVGL